MTTKSDGDVAAKARLAQEGEKEGGNYDGSRHGK